jgi:hypothetical protein
MRCSRIPRIGRRIRAGRRPETDADGMVGGPDDADKSEAPLHQPAPLGTATATTKTLEDHWNFRDQTSPMTVFAPVAPRKSIQTVPAALVVGDANIKGA